MGLQRKIVPNRIIVTTDKAPITVCAVTRGFGLGLSVELVSIRESLMGRLVSILEGSASECNRRCEKHPFLHFPVTACFAAGCYFVW